MDKMREHFEREFSDEYNMSKMDDGKYKYHQTQNAYIGFCAGYRYAIKVALESEVDE